MNRRDSIFALLALVAAPCVATAQQQDKVWRVGVLSQRGRPASLEADSTFGGFLQGMRDLGYREGKDLVVEWRFADGDSKRLQGLAADLVRLRVDVILAAGTPATSAAQKATIDIPIVMGTVGDPVGSGFVKSLARPGGNITGLSNVAGEIGSKLVEILFSAVPNLSRVAILINPDNSVHAAILKNVRVAAQRARVKVLPVEVRTSQEIEKAFSVMTQENVGGVIVASDQYFLQQRRQIAGLATKYRMPSIMTNREYAEAGGLMSYGQSVSEHYRRAASYVDRILRGTKPGDLPVERTTKFEMVVNLETAKAIGVTIPQSVLLRADRVIE